MSTSITTTACNNVINSNVVTDSANVAPVVSIAEVAETAKTKEQELNIAAYNRIKMLSNERQNWNDTVYKTSNDMLYGILQQCYQLYFDMCGKTKDAEALRNALAKLIEERSIKVLKSTHTLTIIVRCVFDGERKRFNTYSRVLQAALAEKKAVNELPDYIYEKGGIDEIRRPTTKNELTTADKASHAASVLRGKLLATVDSSAVAETLDAAKDGEQHVAIVTQRAGGVIEVNAIVFSETVLKAALSAYYNANKDAVSGANANAKTAAKQVENAETLEELAKQAA